MILQSSSSLSVQSPSPVYLLQSESHVQSLSAGMVISVKSSVKMSLSFVSKVNHWASGVGATKGQ